MVSPDDKSSPVKISGLLRVTVYSDGDKQGLLTISHPWDV